MNELYLLRVMCIFYKVKRYSYIWTWYNSWMFFHNLFVQRFKIKALPHQVKQLLYSLCTMPSFLWLIFEAISVFLARKSIFKKYTCI